MDLPEGLTVLRALGEGRRSRVYLADDGGAEVVVKIYRNAFIAKYRDRYGVDIGEFEIQRNRALYEVPALRRYVARPLRLVAWPDGSRALVQENVGGTPLLDLVRELGGLPGDVLNAGHFIVGEAAKLGIHDLDLSPPNIRVLRDEAGWYPKLHDFNLMPQHLFPPNPFMALGIRLGLRSKNHRDYRCLAEWKRLGRNAVPEAERKKRAAPLESA